MTKPKANKQPAAPKAPDAPASTAYVIDAPAGTAPPDDGTEALSSGAVPPDADQPAVETETQPDTPAETDTAKQPDESPAVGASMVDPLIEKVAPDGEAIEPEEGVYACNVITLAAARALPEVGPEIEPLPMVYAPGSIERFKAEDGRTMSVIRVHGAIAAQPA